MTVYRGRTNNKNLAAVINTALVNEGWQQISSLVGNEVATDGRVYKSVGTSGTDEIYIKIRDGANAAAPLVHLIIGVADKYVPSGTQGVAGVFTNLIEETSLKWNSSTYKATHNVDYTINVTKNRIIIHLQGMKADAGWVSCITYAGLIKRYDSTDTMAIGIAGSSGTVNTKGFRALRNRALTANFYYTYDYYATVKSFGTNGQIFFSPMYVGSTDEGPRGEMDGLYMLETLDQTYEFQHLDTFSKNGKNYMIVSRVSDIANTTSLPVTDFVMEI